MQDLAERSHPFFLGQREGLHLNAVLERRAHGHPAESRRYAKDLLLDLQDRKLRPYAQALLLEDLEPLPGCSSKELFIRPKV